MQARTIAALCVFVAGAFAGAFLTSLVRLAPSDWHYWVGARVLWQLGGGLWFGYELGRLMTDRFSWQSVAACGALGAVLSLNPLLDLIRGPLAVEGAIVSERYDRNEVRRSIKARVAIRSADGTLHELNLWGRQANIYEELAEGCGGPQAGTRFVFLRHLDAFLSVECRRDPAGHDSSASTGAGGRAPGARPVPAHATLLSLLSPAPRRPVSPFGKFA